MFKKLSKVLCMVLCLVMLVPGAAAFAEGPEYGEYNHPVYDPTPHTDIPEDASYTNACRFVYYDGCMNGTSATTFSPEMFLTREMAVVIILAHYKEYIPEYTFSYFLDVEPGRWYSNAIQWAYEIGLTAGVGNGNFGLGEYITKQDFITMLYVTFNPNGTHDCEEQCKLEYKDGDYSEYAKEAIRYFGNWHKYESGLGLHYENPAVFIGSDYKNYLTRAETAQMLYKAIPNYYRMSEKVLDQIRYK